MYIRSFRYAKAKAPGSLFQYYLGQLDQNVLKQVVRLLIKCTIDDYVNHILQQIVVVGPAQIIALI